MGDWVSSIISALGNLFSSGAGSAAGDAAGQVSGGELGSSVAGNYGNLPSWLSGAGSGLGNMFQSAGSYAVDNPGTTASLLGQAGSAGMGIANQIGSMAPPSPISPMGNFTGTPMQPPGMSQGQLRNMISNRQASGVYSGGATTPESMAALGGNEQSQDQIGGMMGNMYPGYNQGQNQGF